ncbi:MAG TPA: ParB N-terminal domain-containing protein [Planctomycetota bacterium]|nr:ParB N-terminal domain-containing protein [Planctomycetota bacterium]
MQRIADTVDQQSRSLKWLTAWLLAVVALLAADALLPRLTSYAWHTYDSGTTIPQMLSIYAAILAAAQLLKISTTWFLRRKGRPLAEGAMVGKLYQLAAVLAIILSTAYGFGKLGAFGAFFAMFGGMLLGWSLQAPVSGFAAWVLVSLKRPFRPGDRVQFPNLGLTGDVKDVGVMYTMLDQVGGSIGSEEAVGRYILVPNAMLFSQVVINYTVTQEAAYMLDEVVIRITYDSHWETAERILLDAAREITRDIIAATGAEPYIRSDLYDYGVYLRLRYTTHVQKRVETSYRIQKRIFEEIQRTPSVDLAIPYVYSYRAGADKRDDLKDKEGRKAQLIEVSRVQPGDRVLDSEDVEQVARSIVHQGLLQPIIVGKADDGDGFRIMAGDLRFEACKKLGWKTIPAIIIDNRPAENGGTAGAVS